MSSSPVTGYIIIVLCVLFAVAVPIAILLLERRKKRRAAAALQDAAKADYQRVRDLASQHGFRITKGMNFFAIHFLIDDDSNKVMLVFNPHHSGCILNYSDIISYEFIEDGQTITSGSTGKAVAGAVLFGTAGAVVGSTMHNTNHACSLMQLRLTINDISNPHIVMPIISPPGLLKSDPNYAHAFNFAKEASAAIDVIIRRQSPQQMRG